MVVTVPCFCMLPPPGAVFDLNQTDAGFSFRRSASASSRAASADLAGANLSEASMCNIDLRGCALRGATMTRAVLIDADLRDGYLVRYRNGDFSAVAKDKLHVELSEAKMKGLAQAGQAVERRYPANRPAQFGSAILRLHPGGSERLRPHRLQPGGRGSVARQPVGRQAGRRHPVARDPTRDQPGEFQPDRRLAGRRGPVDGQPDRRRHGDPHGEP